MSWDQAATCCPAKTQSQSHYCQDKLSSIRGAGVVRSVGVIVSALSHHSVTMELEFVSPIIFRRQIRNNKRNFLII